jgi:hypothetical protein
MPALPGRAGGTMRELTMKEARQEIATDDKLCIIHSDGPEVTRQSFLARADRSVEFSEPTVNKNGVCREIKIVGWIRK